MTAITNDTIAATILASRMNASQFTKSDRQRRVSQKS
jgi:hypothetical protein